MSKLTARRAPGPQLSVPVTSFDLLEGGAIAQVRARAVNGVLLILVVAVFATLLSRGVLSRVETANENGTKAAAQSESSIAQETLRDKRNSGEVSIQAVEEHIDARVQLVRAITTDEVDVARIMTDLANLGPDVSVTNITLGADAATPEDRPGRGNTTTTQAVQPTDEAAKAKAIRISGTATNQTAATEAARALSDPNRFPYLSSGSSGEVDCTSDNAGAQVCTWAWAGRLSDGGLGSRTEDLVTRAKQPFVDATGGGN